jgi:hypothetical protein
MKSCHWIVYKDMASNCANGFNNLLRTADGGDPPVSILGLWLTGVLRNRSVFRIVYIDLGSGLIV